MTTHGANYDSIRQIEREVLQESLDSPMVAGILTRYIAEGNAAGMQAFHGAVADVTMTRLLASYEKSGWVSRHGS